VTVLVPASAQPVLEQRLVEVMTRGLPERDGAHTEAGADAVLEAAERVGSIVLGPGLSKADEALAFGRAVARRARVPLVIDADGLNAHAGRLADLAARGAPTVLTPHAGELGRLLGVESADVDAHRLHHARAAAEASQAIVVLKGDDTLVAEPGGLVAVSAGATPGWPPPGPATCSAGSPAPSWPAASSRSRPPAPPCASTLWPAPARPPSAASTPSSPGT
jgi:NAD(P)H-hydrate epimerase